MAPHQTKMTIWDRTPWQALVGVVSFIEMYEVPAVCQALSLTVLPQA